MSPARGTAVGTRFTLSHSVAWYDTNTEPPFRYSYSMLVGTPTHERLVKNRGDSLGPETYSDRSVGLGVRDEFGFTFTVRC